MIITCPFLQTVDQIFIIKILEICILYKQIEETIRRTTMIFARLQSVVGVSVVIILSISLKVVLIVAGQAYDYHNLSEATLKSIHYGLIV